MLGKYQVFVLNMYLAISENRVHVLQLEEHQSRGGSRQSAVVFAQALFGPHVENLRGRTEVSSSRGTVSASRALVMDTGY